MGSKKKSAREIEECLGKSLRQVYEIIYSDNYQEIAKFFIVERNLLLTKEACNSEFLPLKWDSVEKEISLKIVEFLKAISKVEINLENIQIHNIVSIEKEILKRALNTNDYVAADIITSLHTSKSGYSKMIEDPLIAHAKAIRIKKLKSEAIMRIKPYHVSVATDFLKSKKGFEEFVLSYQDKRLTVGSLQRILLDCELLGKLDPALANNKGFTLSGYLRSLDNVNVQYILFEHEDEVLAELEKYAHTYRENDEILTEIQYPFNKSKRIPLKYVLKYCEKYYPKKYKEAMITKQESIARHQNKKRQAAEEKKVVYGKELYNLYSEPLSHFEDFLGDDEAFREHFSIDENDFEVLVDYLKLKVPEKYSFIKSEMDEYYSGIMDDYISDIMEVQAIYQALGKDFIGNPQRVQTFLYEYFHACTHPLPEVLAFVKTIKIKAPKVFEENRELLFPAYSVGFNLTKEKVFTGVKSPKGAYDLFKIDQYLMTNHMINGIKVTRETVEYIMDILQSNEIPLFNLIVENAIIKYCHGNLDEYMSQLPINSDHMKRILFK